jgi:hypothetical protein
MMNRNTLTITALVVLIAALGSHNRWLFAGYHFLKLLSFIPLGHHGL